MPILNYTTQIDIKKTANGIQNKLSEAGAEAVMVEYRDGDPSAISFRIQTPQGLLSFRMPSNPDGVLKALINHPKVPQRLCHRQQATRVSWRILKDWVEVQLAMVESGNAELTQVFLSYVQHPETGQPLFERLKDQGFAMLTEKAGDSV